MTLTRTSKQPGVKKKMTVTGGAYRKIADVASAYKVTDKSAEPK